MTEIKDKESNPDSESDSENNGKEQIIDADPTVIVMIAVIQPEEPIDPEEGEHLFHSQRSSNSWDCRQHHTRYHIALGGFAKDEIFVLARSVDCHTASNPSRMRYYVMFPCWMFFMSFWANHICGSAMLFMSLDPVV